ncbi:hypothetical protein, partial [Burkholderia gladioli]|uniref:hypothetical protein n=1 Tax=Burkholderia gladioli TaxID=28095 RepID=UPI003F7A48CD
ALRGERQTFADSSTLGRLVGDGSPEDTFISVYAGCYRSRGICVRLASGIAWTGLDQFAQHHPSEIPYAEYF